MNNFLKTIASILFLALAIVACKGKKEVTEVKNINLKGLYSYGPEIKSFTDCEEGREYWVTDSAKQLELAYNNLDFEKPYIPVYVEIEGHFIKSDTSTITGDFDSTLVVTKLIKISKNIPVGLCLQ
jgi:copper homeostasis protein (lipoprotein)